MDLRRCVWLTAIALLVVMTVTGCSRRTPPPAPPPPAPPVATTPAPPPAPPPPATPPAQPAPQQAQRALTEDEIFAKKTVDDLNNERVLVEVFFDYDQFNIRDDQRGALQKNGDYLRRWPSVRVTIEGHADERGTAEYNLALGERRANAVMQYFAGLGIAANRMVVVSKGKETPSCRETTEECHARNRRVFFMVTAK
jgi:peptidoglycan-associated lipoprotein